MKCTAIVLSIIGIASGVAFALGPWVFGVRDLTVSSFVGPAIFGAVLILTHWLTLRRIQSLSPKKAGLMAANIGLLLLMATGFLFIMANPAGGERPVARVVLLAALFVAPLGSNIFHLASRRIPSEN